MSRIVSGNSRAIVRIDARDGRSTSTAIATATQNRASVSKAPRIKSRINGPILGEGPAQW